MGCSEERALTLWEGWNMNDWQHRGCLLGPHSGQSHISSQPQTDSVCRRPRPSPLLGSQVIYFGCLVGDFIVTIVDLCHAKVIEQSWFDISEFRNLFF